MTNHVSSFRLETSEIDGRCKLLGATSAWGHELSSVNVCFMASRLRHKRLK